MSEAANGSVSYSVKELLARQDGKLDAILLTLGGKAEHSDMLALATRVEVLERADSAHVGTMRLTRWAIPVLLSLASFGVALFALARAFG